MSETETEKKQITNEEKREQIIDVVEEAEKVEEVKEKDSGYPADGHIILARFASTRYGRRDGKYFLLEDEEMGKQ